MIINLKLLFARLLIICFFLFFYDSLLAQKNKQAVFSFESVKFIKNWLVCGPFPVQGTQNLYSDYLSAEGGEGNLVPTVGMKHSSGAVPGGEVSWKFVNGSADGKLDLGASLSPNQNNICYAAVIVRCNKQTPALLKLGSNDMLAVWLNGQQVYVYPDPRASGPDVDKVAVNLKKGDNILLAKVQNVGGRWWLYSRFEELFSIDGEVFSTKPVVSSVPKRVDDAIADMFSVMLFNASENSSGPVKFTIGNDERELAVIDDIKPGATVWLTGNSTVNGTDYSKELTSNIMLATSKGSNTFHIKYKRNPIHDGTTWFLQGFHVDPVWRDSQSGYQALTFSNLSQHLRAAQADPEFDFFMSEIPYLKPFYDTYPGDRALIRDLIKEGRVETGGSYNQPNETTISGEAFIRNILYGRLFHENVLGDKPKTYQPWDVFGHIIQLPQILSKSEFIGTIWERSNYRSSNVRVPGIPDLYFAQSPDGTTLPTRKLHYGFGNPGGGVANEAEIKTRLMMADLLKHQQLQIDRIKYDLRLNATDEKAPSAWMVGRCNTFESYIPRVRLSADGGQKYFEHVLDQYQNDNLDIPVVSRDVSQYNEGCELSRFDLKSGNRLGENVVIAAEKFSTFANVMGMPYPARALDKAWRQLLYGQHHDGITGCGADVPYLDLVAAYHEALDLGSKSLYAALTFIGDKANVNHVNKNAIPIVVFNSLNWQRDDITSCKIHFEKPVKGFKLIDAHGQKVPCIMEDEERNSAGVKSAAISFVATGVPSVGYKTWWVVSDKVLPPKEVQMDDNRESIENDYYRIVVDKNLGGGINSLIDKTTGKEFINTDNGHPGNELILLKEGPGFEPAWRFLTTGEKHFSKDFSANIEVFESPLYKKLVITGDMVMMKKRIQEIKLYNGLQRIDFRTYLVDYEGLGGKDIIENDKRPRRNDRDFYIVSFPTNLSGTVPVLEDRFATKTYYHSKDFLSYSSTSTEWTTHHAMNSCGQWIDYSYSVLVNFGNDNSFTLGPVEILTTRDSRKAGFRLQTALANRGITSTPGYPDVERDYDIQYRRFSFSAGAHGKNAYNEKLIRRLKSAKKQIIVRQLEDKGYAYAFVYDDQLKEAWFDLPVLMIIGRDEMMTKKAIDMLSEQLHKTGHINLSAEAFMADKKTSVDDYGLAIINRGNLPVSVEPDGSMILSLMHTIPWQSPLLKWTHDFPERKTHVFDYALYPHKGNWQSADIVFEGYNFNNPLLAIQSRQHYGKLPDEYSFISTAGKKCIVSAIKPVTAGTEAFAMKSRTNTSNGIIVRMYDPVGDAGEVEVNTSIDLMDVQKVNLMERQGNDIPNMKNHFTYSLYPYSIETFLLKTNVMPEELQAGFEPVIGYPVYGKFWEHNEGAAPLGYMPVNVVIVPSPNLDRDATRKNIRQVKVAVTNDYTDSPVHGFVNIETPPGIRAVPDRFEYNVDANSESFYPVAIILEGQQAPGFIRASIKHDGMILFDVLEFKLPEKLFGHAENIDTGEVRIKWVVSYSQNRVTVNLENPFAQSVDGEVTFIGPVETWGDCAGNSSGLLKTTPWHRSFHLSANSNKNLYFDIEPMAEHADDAYWLVAKLSYFGYLDYKPAVGKLIIEE